MFSVDVQAKRILQLVQAGLACLGLLACVFILALVLSTSARESSYTLLTTWIFGAAEEEPIQEGSAQANDNTNALSELQAGINPSNLTFADLSPSQAKVTKWLSLRYNVAIDPIVPLVAEAWTLGPQMGVKPTLLLAVAAIESRFNPIAQSHLGAQGLMQVRTSVHEDRYEEHGGLEAVFDPVINMRVGASILQEYIRRFGGIEKGLNAYVGAAYSGNHNGYASKVLSVQKRLDAVMGAAKKTTATEPKATTTLPKVATTEPEATATESEAMTTEPKAATTEPEVTAAEPEEAAAESEAMITEFKAATTEPEVTAAEPEAMTTKSEAMATEPKAATTEPEAMITEFKVATTEPEAPSLE